ncbi:Ring finger protein [Melia azedarach]|uniref:Ring finger protein n=1 Tax=Melia azedarach TaxID=155640 RepID=A0ACC1X254_MELAZ|nr:Ring finger protein [Melia azedarach]
MDYSYLYQVKRLATDKLRSDYSHEIAPPHAVQSRLDRFCHALLDLDQHDPVSHLVYEFNQKLFQETKTAILNPSWNEPVPRDHQLQLLLKIADVANAALGEAKDDKKQRRGIQIQVILTIKRKVKRDESDGIMEQHCVICLNEFKNLYEVTKLPCGCKQFYHDACVWTWVEKQRSCPTCRRDFTCKPVETTTATAARQRLCS